MSPVGYALYYVGIVICLLWIVRFLSRIESHLAALRRDQQKPDPGSPAE